jgi:hypothetical protein
VQASQGHSPKLGPGHVLSLAFASKAGSASLL